MKINIEMANNDISNFICTYRIKSWLSKSGGFVLNFAYSVPIALSKILLPVFPDLNWFLNTRKYYFRNTRFK